MRVHRSSRRPTLARPFCAAMALAAASAFAAAAHAQVYDDPAYLPDPAAYAPTAYVDEIVVPAPLGPDGRPSRLSRAIDIADLDLIAPADRDVLRLRVRATARDLCRELGEEASGPSPLIPSCQDQAVRDARPQVRAAIDRAFARAAYAVQQAPDPYAWRPAPY